MKVVIDTSAFIAFFVQSDSYHKQVALKYQKYKQEHALLLTSDYILDELYTRLIYDFGKFVLQRAIDVLQKSISDDQLRVLSIDEIVFKKATDILFKFSDHKISFTDATTYVLYKDLQLDEIFTLDRDFKKMRIATSF